jgi:hypothetical protein
VRFTLGAFMFVSIILVQAFGQAFPQQAFDQDELRSWLPTRVGDTWVYQNESSPKMDRWRTEERVVRLIVVSEGTIVVRRVRVLDGNPPVAEPKEQAWLMHGDCLYDLTSAEWDAGHPNQLSPAFTARPPWAGGEHERVFCFPLSQGKTWGKESGQEWHAADVTDQDASSPDKGKTFHVSSTGASGLAEDIWFERGVGIVREDAVHSGTNQAGSHEEKRAQLLLFEPAPRAAIGSVPAPSAEVGMNYSYNSLEISTSGESNQSGGSIYGQYFFKGAGPGWNGRALIGIVAGFSGSASGSGSLYTYLFGPRISTEWQRAHLVYYFEPNLGAARVRVNGTTPAGIDLTAARNSLAYGFVAGLGLRAGRRAVITLFQVDADSLQVPEPVSGTSRWRNDSRISGGVSFRFDRH